MEEMVKGNLDITKNPFDFTIDDSNPFEDVVIMTNSNNNSDDIDFDESTSVNNVTQQTDQQRKYSIIEMFWMVNEKIVNNQSLTEDEAAYCVIGFNATFGNMRVEFRKQSQNKLNYIVQNQCPRITSFNIYSEEAFEILEKIQKGEKFNHMVRERIINQQNWYPNESKIMFNNGRIGVMTVDNNQKVKTRFIMSSVQTKMFITALKYMISGQAWNMMLLCNL
ncbi:MAG: hypothetical protein QXD03_05435 [Candidatus Anstonellales archaeon]